MDKWFYWWILSFQEEITPILHYLFEKVEEEVTVLNLFYYEASVILVFKLDKDSTVKESYRPNRPMFLVNTDPRILNKILVNQI